jgi:hypothetical protein
MKREVAAELVDSLKEAGVDFVATLTEANLHELVMALGEDKEIHHVPVTREEEGIGICAGAYLGGKRPAMVMMNAGFLLSTNALATVCIHPGMQPSARSPNRCCKPCISSTRKSAGSKIFVRRSAIVRYWRARRAGPRPSS